MFPVGFADSVRIANLPSEIPNCLAICELVPPSDITTLFRFLTEDQRVFGAALQRSRSGRCRLQLMGFYRGYSCIGMPVVSTRSVPSKAGEAEKAAGTKSHKLQILNPSTSVGAILPVSCSCTDARTCAPPLAR